MIKVEYCTALPGCCYLCRSSNRLWYVDTNQSVDDYGAMYICNSCIMEMSHIAGMATSDEVVVLNNQIDELERQNFDYQVRVSGLEQAIDGLRLAGRSIGDDANKYVAVSTPKVTEESSIGEESVGHEGGTPPESDNDSDVGELHTDESNSDRPSFSLDI